MTVILASSKYVCGCSAASAAVATRPRALRARAAANSPVVLNMESSLQVAAAAIEPIA